MLPGLASFVTVVCVQVADMPQETRNYVARLMLRLTLRELFEFRFMQTDPNWGNFLYDPVTGKISVIDFGAANEYSETFVRDYAKLVRALVGVLCSSLHVC